MDECLCAGEHTYLNMGTLALGPRFGLVVQAQPPKEEVPATDDPAKEVTELNVDAKEDDKKVDPDTGLPA